MKKKFKLFATIGSLCLAVAMMTIGVLAATSVTFNVTSSVSFASETVLVDIAAEVTGAVEGTKTYAGFTADPTKPNEVPSKFEVGALTFSETNTTITYEITITNRAETAVTATVTGAPATTDQLEVTVDNKIADIAKGSSATYTLTLKLLKFDASLETTTVNLVMELA